MSHKTLTSPSTAGASINHRRAIVEACALEGIELWIVDFARRGPHPTHSHLAKTLSWIARLRPRRAVLTRMDQSLDHREFAAELPSGVETRPERPGY
jgi:phosphoribosyl 1,2-cyclic phosphodiesterase